MKRSLASALCFLGAAFTATAWVDRDDAWVAGRKNWWSFQPVKRADVPAISDPWVSTPIDAFILEALRDKAITPVPPLDKARLARRAAIDLTGLPLPPARLRAYMKDKSPQAYEKLVDELMRSPQYGERWALKWLDVVRYADTNGYEADGERLHAWRYRDYVVQSFAAGKPYDRFLREQLAGDELYPGDRDALIATGFHRAGPTHMVGGNTDKEMLRQEVLTEMTGAIGSVFMGLTIGCARCHNHKFDPIPQSDYYRLQAVFAGTQAKEIPLATPEEKAAREAGDKAHKARLEPIRKQLAEIEKPYQERIREEHRKKLAPEFVAALDTPKDKRNDEQKRLVKEAEAQIKVPWYEIVAALPADVRERRAALRRQMHDIEYEKPEPGAAAWAIENMESAPATHILKVGNHKMKLDPVGPGLLRVLTPPVVDEKPTGRRAALAEWLASPKHPLTARVMANRIWQLRMGTGLVATPNDFGMLGAKPSNAKLLDWLASEFVEKGWSVKAIDRLILTSSVYRLSPARDEARAAIDPGNKLYGRANRRRLEAELLRDNVLAASGTLNGKMGGRPVRVPIEKEVYDLIFTEGEPDNLWPANRDESEHRRRSLYLLNKRTIRLPFLANFDQPDNMSSCPVRPASIHALQALSLLNSDLMKKESEAFAERLRSECKGADCQVKLAYTLALSRDPAAAEMAMAKRFFASGGPLADFCLALLNRNEFVYVP